jgi:peptidoglycan/LPS O-acetylase OafA/YrhL
MMLIMNGTLTTDTFFLLSGILLAYVFMREWQKQQAFNLATFYMHRYLRCVQLCLRHIVRQIMTSPS